MLLTRTGDPSTILTLADIKSHLRIDHAFDDVTLETLRNVSTEVLDGSNGYLRRALCTQTWTWSIPEFPIYDVLHMPLPPLQSVTSVSYYDADDNLQTLAADQYHVYSAYVGYIKLKRFASWPATVERDDAVSVTFVAGYGTPSQIPSPIKQAALIRCGALYDSRGDSSGGGSGATEAQIRETGFSEPERRLLGPYRLTEMVPNYEQYRRKTRAYTD